ncbi:hypothetical protein Q0601_12985 [Paracoccus onubensis]|uniref:hypothetical protein n=1 Tax=Paracoccus onubensis TaxID=1675788 RepID=UPI0027305C24|nr:hypothetical protein [Paracoccus onubensis]MDP0928093.1 hypothetical protein [Paracoccus onubensis]
MTRILAILMILAGLAVPAAAQDETGGDSATENSDAAAVATQEDDDEDDDDEEAGGGGEGVHEAAGKFDYGFSGVLARDNRTDLAPLTLASGQPVASDEYTLKSGGYYRIDINADGSQELALSGGDFFRAVWVNEVVINDIEIRPMGVHSLEFDDAGTASMSFIAIVPGRYTLSIPGSSGETQQAVFNIQ